MSTIVSYNTPQAFLDATESVLEQKELENNLMLGICYGFEDKMKVYDQCVFINSIEADQIQASSIKTIAKVIVTGSTKNTAQIRPLADYYLDQGIEVYGAIGETFYATEFSNFYGKKQIKTETVIVHQLDKVNPLPLASGDFESATSDDLDLLTAWTIQFEKDANIFPKQSVEQIHKSVLGKINSGNFFKWVDHREIVSMAAIARKTKNIGIVGYVYTPENLRGRGYATSCVHRLSEVILSQGFRYCGLFTDKANPTSNHIYKNIGYAPRAAFADIQYG